MIRNIRSLQNSVPGAAGRAQGRDGLSAVWRDSLGIVLRDAPQWFVSCYDT